MSLRLSSNEMGAGLLSHWTNFWFLGRSPLSLHALRVLFGIIGIVWLLSYAMHVCVSAEGTELFRAAGEYRLLREEQKERHRRYRAIGGGR